MKCDLACSPGVCRPLQRTSQTFCLSVLFFAKGEREREQENKSRLLLFPCLFSPSPYLKCAVCSMLHLVVVEEEQQQIPFLLAVSVGIFFVFF